MALMVEDGTGLEEAEAYVSLADHKTYWAKRGVTLSDTYSDEQLEVGLRKGFQYINSHKWRYKGCTLTGPQAGEFPRENLTDWNGRVVTGVPRQVKEANNELALKSQTEDIFADLERGGRVASESVGPISVSYFADAPSSKTYTLAFNLLRPFTRDVNQPHAPYIGGAAGQASTEDAPSSLTPIFAVGMHTNSDS